MFNATSRGIAVLVAIGAALCLQIVSATPGRAERKLPAVTLDAAMAAANEAIKVCASKGWPVSVSVVEASGVVKLQAKGDRSAPHTMDASFRKAYTTVSYAPLFHFSKLSEWVEALKTNPLASAYATLPNIFLLPGAVTLKDGDEVVGAIGVAGAPGGSNDEICAEAGLAKFADGLSERRAGSDESK